MALNEPITRVEARGYIARRNITPTGLSSKEIAAQWSTEIRSNSFFSARVAKADLLEGIREQLQRAISGEIAPSQAKRIISEFLETKGRSSMAALGFIPTSREANQDNSLTQLASTRRISLIVNQNLRMAHAVGEYKQAERDKEFLPWAIYQSALTETTRVSHALLHNKAVKVGTPLYRKLLPPNGFNCLCWMDYIDAADYAEEKPKRITDVPSGIESDEFQFNPEGWEAGTGFEVDKKPWKDDIKKKFNEDIAKSKEARKLSESYGNADVSGFDQPHYTEKHIKNIRKGMESAWKGNLGVVEPIPRGRGGNAAAYYQHNGPGGKTIAFDPTYVTRADKDTKEARRRERASNKQQRDAIEQELNDLRETRKGLTGAKRELYNQGIARSAEVLAELKAVKRWSVSHVARNPLSATAAHEAGHALQSMHYGLTDAFNSQLAKRGATRLQVLSLSEYAATVSADGRRNRELWAEVTAAISARKTNLVPPNILEAYYYTIALAEQNGIKMGATFAVPEIGALTKYVQ